MLKYCEIYDTGQMLGFWNDRFAISKGILYCEDVFTKKRKKD